MGLNPEKLQQHFSYQATDRGDGSNKIELALVTPAGVRELCDETFDCLSLVQQMAVALTVRVHGGPGPIQRQADDVLSAFSTYFREHGVCLKRTVEVPTGESLAKLDRSVRVAQEKSDVLMQKDKRYQRLLVPSFIDAVSGASARIRAGHSDGGMVLIGTPHHRDHDAYPSYMKGLRELISAIGKVHTSQFPDLERLRVHEAVLEGVQILSKNRVTSVPDMYTASFRGVSLAQLAREPDQEKFVQQAMLYLQHIPKGNLLWQQVVGAIFFTHPISDNTLRIEPITDDFFSQPQLARNILALQAHIATNIFLPPIANTPSSREFDRTMTSIIRHMDADNCTIFRGMLIHMLYGYHRRALALNPRASYEEIADQFPIAKHLLGPLTPEVDIDAFDHIVRYVRQEYFFSGDTLIENFSSRFGKNANLDKILNILPVALVGKGVESAVGANVEAIATQVAEPIDLARYLTAETGPDLAKHELRSTTATGRLTDYSERVENPEGGALWCARFTPRSLPTSLGFETVFISYPAGESNTIKFILETVDRLTFLTGVMDREGNVTELNAQFDEMPHMSVIIGHIIKATHDFFKQAEEEAAEVAAMPALQKPEKSDPEKAYRALSVFFEVPEKSE